MEPVGLLAPDTHEAEHLRFLDTSIPPTVSPTSAMIVDERVLRPRDSVIHVVLSVVAGTGLLVLGGLWIRESWTGRDLWLTSVATLLLCTHVAVWSARWLSLWRMKRPVHIPAPSTLRVAAVTTFVASQEPIQMLAQTLRAMGDMRVAHDTWVLDEEDDEEVRELCTRLGARHFSRAGMPEFREAKGPLRAATKHGNYNAWFAHTGYDHYDVVAMFDPDHVPDPEYLRRTLGFFSQDDVAFVQPPQVYYNQRASFVARGAAEESYSYYSTHLMASYALGHTIVIGSHGVHRLSALRALGGLPSHDAEDLYLTMLYKAAGWRGVFVPEVLAMGMTPVDWRSYLRQQLRWSRSLLDLKLRVLPQMAGRLSALERLMNLAHGAFYMRALLVPVAYVLLGGMLIFNVAPSFMQPRAVLSLLTMLLLLGALDQFRQRFYLDPEHERGVHWRASVMQLAKWPVFLRAIAEALRGREVAYLVTPKGASAPHTHALAPVQIGVASMMALAWCIGTLLHGALKAPLTAWAGVVIVLSLAIAASDVLRSVSAFDNDTYRARRLAMNRPQE